MIHERIAGRLAPVGSIVLATLLAAILASFACLAPSPASAQAQAPQTTELQPEPYIVVLNSSKWNQDTIPVCWEYLAANFERERELVRKAVADSWSAHSKIQFTGWEKCADLNGGIRISIEDSAANAPHTNGLGKEIDGRTGGMVLNFTFEKWGTTCANQRDFCITSIAVHEFGHALGFAHEQNRADTPGECLAPPQGTSGDVYLTPWDIHSVMNYCNPEYNNNGQLSASDIVGLQKVYGAN